VVNVLALQLGQLRQGLQMQTGYVDIYMFS
jgi:hypothetical protein